MTIHVYSVAGDTANGIANGGSLDSEVRQDPTITKALDGVGIAGDVLTVTFKEALPSPTQTDALDAVVAAHLGVALASPTIMQFDDAHVDENGAVKLAPGNPQGLRGIHLTHTIADDINALATDNVIPWNTEGFKDTGFTHDNVTNNSRVVVSADGLYLIFAGIRVIGNPTSGNRWQGNTRIRKNGTTTITERTTSTYARFTDSVDHADCLGFWIVKLLNGDYIEVLVDRDSSRSTAMDMVPNEAQLDVVKLEGVKGDQGPSGSGSSIIIKEEGVNLGNTPHSALDLVSDLLTATDEGGGIAKLVFGGTLAALNTAMTDATLDDSSASRPPNGAASGDLAGSFPSPTIPAGSVTQHEGSIDHNALTNLATGDVHTQYLKTDGTRALTGDLQGGGNEAKGFADPTLNDSLATMAYVKALLHGLDPKGSVTASTTAALPANSRTVDVLTADANGAFPTIDGVSAVINQEYLVQDEVTAINNGIYELTQLGDGSNPWKLTRRVDFADGASVAGAFLFVEQGTTFAEKQFVCTNDSGTDVVNTDALAFTQQSGGATDHGDLGGLGDDDHSQYHTDGRGDARYFQKSEHIDTSAGAGDSGKPIKLDSGGKVDGSMILLDQAVGGDLAGNLPNPEVAQVSKSFAFKGVLTPPQLTGNVDNYDPVGLSDTLFLDQDADGTYTCTGLKGGSNGRLFFWHNGSSNFIALDGENSSSDPGHRFAQGTSFGPGRVAVWRYRGTIPTGRWHLIGGVEAFQGLEIDKIQAISPNTLLGREDDGFGFVQKIVLDDTLEIDGSLNIGRAAITGAVSIPAGSNVSTFAGLIKSQTVYGDQMGVAHADFPVLNIAPTDLDNTKNRFPVAVLDSLLEQIRWWGADSPASAFYGFDAGTLKLKVMMKARTAPAGQRTVGLRFYYSNIPVNAAVPAWKSIDVADFTIEANAFFQNQIYSLTIGGGAGELDITAGQSLLMGFARINPIGGTELTGDAHLLRVVEGWMV